MATSRDAVPPADRWAALPQPVRDAVIMVVLLISAVVPPAVMMPRTPVWVVIMAAAAAIGVVVLRRRFDLVALVIGCGPFFLGSFLDRSGAGVVLPAVVALYTVARRRPRRVGLLCLAGAVAAAILAFGIATDGPERDLRGLVSVITALATAAAFGDANRTRRAYIDQLTDRAERAEATREAEARHRVAEDRLRIAQDLHDVVAHQLAVINLQAGVASSSVRRRPVEAESALEVIHGAARSALREIGGLLTMLRDETDEPGAPTEPVASLDRLDELIEQFRRSGLDVVRTGPGPVGPLPPAVDLVAYRVVQEALTNAHKHGTGRAELDVTGTASQLTITVENPVPAAAGEPRHGSESQRGSGHGLRGLRERVASVRGELVVSRPDEAGRFRLTARIPLAAHGGAVRDRSGPDGAS